MSGTRQEICSALCLVSRLFRFLAEPLLYQIYSASTVDKTHKFVNTLRDRLDLRASVKSILLYDEPRFLYFARDNRFMIPSKIYFRWKANTTLLLQLVCKLQSLHLYLESISDPHNLCSVIQRVRQTAPSGIQPLSKLKTLTAEAFTRNGYPLELIIPLFNIPSLTSFEGHQCYDHPNELELHEVSRMSNITDIKFRGSTLTHGPITRLMRAFKALESLDIVYEVCSGRREKWEMDNDATDLSWEFDFAAVTGAFLEQKKSLKILRLNFHDDSSFPELSFVNTIGSLGAMERLAELDLPQAAFLGNEWGSMLRDHVFADLLPQSLQTLIIRGWTKEIFTELWDLLAQRVSRFRKLRTILLVFPCRDDFEEESLGELKAAFAEFGIRFDARWSMEYEELKKGISTLPLTALHLH